ncbi:ceramide synthase 6 isoform X2 [Pezoporus flaviventris]|uniref:ceramide synthase 6 isoform X2 n=1 Tax=Pezoporus flaviventris TaxID=889875 RepID=UPI002AB07035|nr:ceramide synthase 6 isoform X2 [Pezoporus flaviventris]
MPAAGSCQLRSGKPLKKRCGAGPGGKLSRQKFARSPAAGSLTREYPEARPGCPPSAWPWGRTRPSARRRREAEGRRRPLNLGVRFIAKPCALGLKVQANGPQKAQPNAILEKVFTAITKHPDEKRLEGLSKQLDWDVRSIQRWFRQRRNQEKPSTLTKFCESMWRFTFYLYIFTYGVRFLKKTPWLWNTRQCWNGYPYQPLMPDLHYYYIVELSFYWSLMFSQFIDIKRKDFGIMFTHHIVTVTLITFSYVTNLTRVGTLTLCLHDAADVVLEAAKMANYCKCQKLSDLLFLTFAIVFIVSRLGIYPLWILNTTLFELFEALGNFPALWVFNVLLVILQILHCFWSYLIIKAAYKAISKGKVAKDDRSDIESSSDEEETVPRSKTPHSAISTNGTSGANGTNGYLTGGTCSEEH